MSKQEQKKINSSKKDENLQDQGTISHLRNNETDDSKQTYGEVFDILENKNLNKNQTLLSQGAYLKQDHDSSHLCNLSNITKLNENLLDDENISLKNKNQIRSRGQSQQDQTFILKNQSTNDKDLTFQVKNSDINSQLLKLNKCSQHTNDQGISSIRKKNVSVQSNERYQANLSKKLQKKNSGTISEKQQVYLQIN